MFAPYSSLPELIGLKKSKLVVCQQLQELQERDSFLPFDRKASFGLPLEFRRFRICWFSGRNRQGVGSAPFRDHVENHKGWFIGPAKLGPPERG